MSSKLNNLYQFGEFHFDEKEHHLWQGGELISLSPKASEVLLLLLERNGQFVSKEEIFEKVWADTFVEDGVLTQNIYTLRKALGKSAGGQPIIENKTRLGYRITVPVQKTRAAGGINLQNKNIFSAEAANLRQPLRSSSLKNWRKIGAVMAVGALTAAAGFFGYHFFQTETAVTSSRLEIEKIRLQKITDTADVSFPALSPDGNLAAFKRDGGIYVKDFGTLAETKLEISNVKKFGFLQFSRDGNFLYLRNRASYFLPSDILKVSRFGGEAKRIAENVWSSFSLSPDERQIAFVRAFPNESRQSLIVKNLESGAETELIKLNSPLEFNSRSYPAWSPDGHRLIAIVNKQNKVFEKLILADAKNGKTEDLFFKNFQQVEQSVWLPEKNSLLAAAREGKFYQLYEVTLSDKRIRRVTNDLNNYLAPMISADGKKILTTQHNVFSNIWVIEADKTNVEKQLTFGVSNRDGFNGIDYLRGGEIVYASNEGSGAEVNLWRVNPNDNQRQQLTQNAGNRNEFPEVSPDGNFIYFSSNRAGKHSIWQIEANGENPKQITSGESSNDLFPQISPDGSWLYFIRREAKASAVWRKSLTDSREEKITDERRLTPVNFLALSPDGKYLAFHHLTEKIESDDPKQNFQIAVLELENPQRIKFFSIGGRNVAVSWTADSSSFDYILPGKDGDEIWRQSLAENKPPAILQIFSKEQLFKLVHSPDGKTFAAARGRLQYDAVLLTNFE